jgi:alkanesulfonate monooxygenase SsuD/methylene tetrahydromethanopterin reductase-like flavin-dependent oxidoreductase (luciferase family)
MKAGMLLPHLGDSATRDNVLYIAKEAEKEGIDSLWVVERPFVVTQAPDTICWNT